MNTTLPEDICVYMVTTKYDIIICVDMAEDPDHNSDNDSIEDLQRSVVHLVSKYDEISEEIEELHEYIENMAEIEKRLDDVAEQVEQLTPDKESEDSTDEEFFDQFKSESENKVPDSLKSVVEYNEPTTTYDDIGGLDDVLQRVKIAVEWPLNRSAELDRKNIDVPPGVLLYGPPGTGKTMISRAVANETESEFIKVSGPEIVRSYIGKTPEKIRELFNFAREVSPCVLLFDEIDSIAMQRSSDLESAERAMNRTVSQLLTELDGFDTSPESEDVRIIATTNKKKNIDDALLRPGRLGESIEVPEPDSDGRREILGKYTKNMPTKNLNIPKLVQKTNTFSGDDIESMCNEAGINSIINGHEKVRQSDVMEACKRIKQK